MTYSVHSLISLQPANTLLPCFMFRPRRPRPDLCCLSSCGPLGSRLSLISTTPPAHKGTLLQRELFPLPPVTSHQSQITKSFTIRTSEKHLHNPFRMRTSKTQDLKPFRMNTYKKTREGVPHCGYFAHPALVLSCKGRQATHSAKLARRDGDIGPRTKSLLHCLSHGGSHLEGIRHPRPYRRAHPEVPKSSVSPTHQITKASQP